MDDRTRGPAAVAASCVAIFMPGSLIFGFSGVMAPHWSRAFDVGKAEIGQILFFVLAAVGVFMFLAGSLQRRFGAPVVTAAGAVLYGIGTVMVADASGMRGVYAWALFTGASSACIYAPTLTVVQNWYPSRKGLYSGLVGMFFGLSGAVAAPVYGWMLVRFGYSSTALTVGFGAAAVGILASFLIRMPEAHRQQSSAASLKGQLSLSVVQSLCTRSFWVIWLTFAMVGAAGISMVTLSAGFGLSRGLTLAEALVILTAFNLTNGVSRLVSGFLSDLIGRRLIMSTAFGLAAGAYLLIPHVAAPPAWAFLSAVIGFGFGTLFAVSAPLVGDCFGMETFGAVFGLVFTAFGFLSGALGPWFSGYLLDITGADYTVVFSYLAGLLVVPAVLIWAASRHTECTF
jgi:OFA family oxalate/formate antiporter-like MFS transporter